MKQIIFVVLTALLSTTAYANHCATYFEQKDFAQALIACNTEAEQGDKDAQFNLAFMYYNGDGVKKILKKRYIGLLRQRNKGFLLRNMVYHACMKKVRESKSIKNKHSIGSLKQRKPDLFKRNMIYPEGLNVKNGALKQQSKDLFLRNMN